MTFTTGQCWISEMEPELGLGIVINSDHQRITIIFQGSDTTRVYSTSSAPLKRVKYNIGDTVKTQDGEEFSIQNVTEKAGIYIYEGADVKIPETMLSGEMSFCKPETRLMSGHCDPHNLFDLRLEALKKKHGIRSSELRGITGGRVDLIPHQFYIAREALKRQFPRLLLADEVGLGKTIEACLIMHGLLQRGLASRVLITVPEVLVNQWFVELLRKFNMVFSIINDDSFDDMSDPFNDSELCLCSIETAVEANMKKMFPSDNWDLLIVDEAHHLKWTQEKSSTEYSLIEKISRQTQSVLLLTATPEHYGNEGHFARLRLLDPERYYDFDKFKNETRHYKRTAEISSKIIDGQVLDHKEQKYLETLVSHDTVAKWEYNTPEFKEQFIDDLLDRHGIGRVMFRNSRSAMTNFPKRIPRLVELNPQNDIRPEVKWLSEFVGNNPNKKILLICGSMENAVNIKEELETLTSVSSALFHEGMTLIQRDRTAAWFAEKDGAQLLICSEIGSEGRNFQFAHNLVLLDLPLDPELLEQRIGRLDRIGQTSDISIHVPYTIGSRDEILAKWYHYGLNSFSKCLHGGSRIITRFKDDLETVIEKGSDEHLEKLLQESATYKKKVTRELEQGRDKLLELNSFRPERINKIISQLKALDADIELEKFMLEIFDHFGIKYEEMSERSYLLKPEDLLTDAFPCIPENGTTITYDRNRALSRDDIQFMTWDHPMAIGSIDLLIGSESGNSSIAMVNGDRQGIILESVYLLESVAPAQLHIDRFLPPVPIKVTVNENGKAVKNSNIQNLYTPPTLPNTELLKAIVPDLLESTLAHVEDQGKEIVTGSLDKMHRFLNHEIERLNALREVNDHIRKEEITVLEQQLQQLEKHIKNAKPRLDSIRLILITRA